ncbi:MAG: Fe-S cluster assembly scaffold protein NifU [Armatimonadetes bacterium]|nr:Fe-S cluster assembly scaffold protein NifU [Armatimonadota bacterium]
MYSQKVMEHFMNPKNVGEIENPDGIGQIGNPVCGDMMTFYIKVADDHLSEVKFKTFGCGAAIAVSSMVSEMAKGKTLDEALKITREVIAQELGGLPPNKMHCSNLGADALHNAINDYLAKKSGQFQDKKTGEEKPLPPENCHCPYCHTPVPFENPYCKPCNLKLIFCPHCHLPVSKETDICPRCGNKI